MKRALITTIVILLIGTTAFAQKPEAAFSGYSPGYTGTYIGHTDYSSWTGSDYSGYYRRGYFGSNGFRTIEEENRMMAELEAAKKRERDKESGIRSEPENTGKRREAILKDAQKKENNTNQ